MTKGLGYLKLDFSVALSFNIALRTACRLHEMLKETVKNCCVFQVALGFKGIEKNMMQNSCQCQACLVRVQLSLDVPVSI